MGGAKQRIYRCNELWKRSFHVFDDMRNDNEFCDITFQVGSQSISAHRIIITAAIPHFREILLQKDVNEKGKSIKVSYIEPNALMSIIDFAYCREININMENVVSLLQGACLLRVSELREVCCDFLADNLSPENALNIRYTACDFDCSELLKIIDCYVKEHFYEISMTEDFLSSSFTYLKNLIERDDLNVDNEEKVLEAVLKWVKSSPDDREIHLAELFCKIRMPLIQPLYLANIVEEEELIRLSVSCRDLIDEARNYNLLPDKAKGTCSFSTKQRDFLPAIRGKRQEGRRQIYMIQSKLTYSVQYSDFMDETYFTKESKTFLLSYGSVTELRNQIYAFDRGIMSRYDPARNEYEHYKEVTFPRSSAGVVSFKNKIFVCGGRIYDTASNVVQYFDPDMRVWGNISCMNTSRWSPNVVSFGEYIFVLGGRDSSSVYDYVERYDGVQTKWRTMAPMLTKRCSSGCAALNGKIYVCGGYELIDDENFIETAEVYNPRENKWKFIAPMDTARGEFMLLPYHGKLYAIGGKDNTGERLNTVEIYDPESDEWTYGPSTDANHSICGAVVISDVEFEKEL